MYRHHQFSGDPHPGNFMLMEDGRVAFLDFGLFKVMPKELIELELACQRAGHEGDAERLHRIWSETGFLAHPERFRPDKLLAQFRDATWWYVLDDEIALEPEIATQVLIDMSDPRSQHFGQMRHETLPADHLFGRRVEMLTLAVLSQLRARRTSTASRASGCTASRRSRSSAARRPRSTADQTVWIWSRLVVPGFPDGRPAVMPTRSPGLTQPSSTTRAALAAISSSVTSMRGIEAASTPHISPQRRTVSRPGESA